MTKKPIVYAPIPNFNQETQAVYQAEPVDKGESIEMGIIVWDLYEETELAKYKKEGFEAIASLPQRSYVESPVSKKT